jgi:hypothetical protein
MPFWAKTQRRIKVNHNRSGKFSYGRAAGNIVRGLAVVLAALAVSGLASAQNNVDNSFYQEPSLKFAGGIGVNPVTGVAANGTVNLNVVRGVSPAGPWRIAALEATVRPDGHIRVFGRGLLLAAGNGIGTNAGASVFATLFCGPATTATAHSSNRVALEADGAFAISEFLTPAPPTPCDTPVLLIRNGAGSGVWFAAGIPKVEEERR